MSVVRTVASGAGSRYEPDPLYARFRTLRRLSDEHDHQELLERKSELHREIEDFEAQYGEDSPTEVRERAAELETAAETMELIEDASDWELARYHLSIVNDAITNYSEYVDLSTAALAHSDGFVRRRARPKQSGSRGDQTNS